MLSAHSSFTGSQNSPKLCKTVVGGASQDRASLGGPCSQVGGSRRDLSWAGSYGRSFAWEGSCGVVTGSQGRSFSWAGLQGACPQSWLGQPGQLTLTGWFLDLGSCFTCLTASTSLTSNKVQKIKPLSESPDGGDFVRRQKS